MCVCVLWFQKNAWFSFLHEAPQIDILLRFCAVVSPEVLVFYDVPEKATLDAGIMRGFREIQNRCCHGSPLQQASQYTEGRVEAVRVPIVSETCSSVAKGSWVH